MQLSGRQAWEDALLLTVQVSLIPQQLPQLVQLPIAYTACYLPEQHNSNAILWPTLHLHHATHCSMSTTWLAKPTITSPDRNELDVCFEEQRAFSTKKVACGLQDNIYAFRKGTEWPPHGPSVHGAVQASRTDLELHPPTPSRKPCALHFVYRITQTHSFPVICLISLLVLLLGLPC